MVYYVLKDWVIWSPEANLIWLLIRKEFRARLERTCTLSRIQIWYYKAVVV